MTYTLEQFAAECRKALAADSGRAGREGVLAGVNKALASPEFLETHLGPDATAEREIIYEDPDYGFCICAHVYQGARTSGPHDHGPTWAIYGLASGETEMTDWRIVEPPADGRPGKVALSRVYEMKPGDAFLYDIGDVHAPRRMSSSRLIRIEGCDTMKVQRTPLMAVEEADAAE